MKGLFIVLMLISYTSADNCVTYNFEEDYENLFTSNTGFCINMQNWNIGRFEDTDLTDQVERSNKFIYPQNDLSCVSSFDFPMSSGGIIELNTYMETELTSDQIQVIAFMHDGEAGVQIPVGSALSTPAIGSFFVPGWHTLTITVTPPVNVGVADKSTGYIAILGQRDARSIVLIDSFRYIPPGVDKNECQIYENESAPETTTDSNVEVTTDSNADPTTDSASDATTEQPTTPISEGDDDSFWTPQRIKILIGALLAALILSIISFACFCCCRSNNVSVVVVRP